ncbi:hypothetical protein [Thermostichus vulcanus]|uniref:Bacterial OB-fold domain-containing protein n=1 Tax=Thermostichus vulcanus str. 'Rupite' TaxID=2813851 RepID=A0ABT0C9L8_THEVL|nr:hypothetical protein [Thermostichus vulcanus]MCJ2542479.1 hypothetical protein [Thermostichus vulcanus str. 'Rupite']
MNKQPSQRVRQGSLALLLGLGLVLGGASGCGQLARLGVGTTPIATVAQNPSQHSNVWIRGQVVNQVGVFGQGVYELQDSSGSIWVITDKGIPAMNSTVTVRGKAQEGITVGGRSFGVSLTEVERY